MLLRFPEEEEHYYITCGQNTNTDTYYAFTTDSESLTSSTQSTSTSASTSSSPQSLPVQTSPNTFTTPAQTGSPPATDPPVDSPGPDAEASTGGTSVSNNTGAIVGGVVGCLAVLCACGVAVFWIVRRNKNPRTAASPADPGTPGYGSEQELYANNGWMPRELAGSGEHVPPRELPAMPTPVELPVSYEKFGR